MGEYNILNPGICYIDYKGATEIQKLNGGYRCLCRNRDSTRGFYDSDEYGRPVEDSDLLCCYFCGRVFNKITLKIMRGVYIQ